jgi:hypothetical protein
MARRWQPGNAQVACWSLAGYNREVIKWVHGRDLTTVRVIVAALAFIWFVLAGAAPLAQGRRAARAR